MLMFTFDFVTGAMEYLTCSSQQKHSRLTALQSTRRYVEENISNSSITNSITAGLVIKVRGKHDSID